MKFTIKNTFQYDSSGSLDDVVYFVRYTFQDSGSSAHATLLNSELYRYFLQCDPVTSTEFVAFNSVTTSSLKDWVQSSHGENWGSFTSSIQTTLTDALNLRTSFQPTRQLNWNSGSQLLDVKELASGSSEAIMD